MSFLTKVVISIFVLVDVLLSGYILLHGSEIALLSPKGIIAHQEKQLIVMIAFMGLAVIIPTILLFFFFGYHYHEGRGKRQRSDGGGNNKAQALFWIFPSVLVVIVMGIIWQSTHALDPYKPLVSPVKPMTIQVVALQWRWLFIYPDYGIATVNFVAFPKKTPITFELTADAPMNSFWIPRLGGQMYAMEGMVNKTHLMADESGEYPGSSAEISGEGFAGMRFIAKATTQEEFEAWVQEAKASINILNSKTYSQLARPSKETKQIIYASVEQGLYDQIVMKFMPPTGMDHSTAPNIKHMDMEGMEM